MINLKSFL